MMGLKILRSLPKAKTSADFEKAVAELEQEIAAARADLARLEGEREQVIFAGGDLAKFGADVARARETVTTLEAALTGAQRRHTEALERERDAELEAEAGRAREVLPEFERDYRALYDAFAEVGKYAGKIQEKRELIKGVNHVLHSAGRTDLVIDDPLKRVPEVMGRHVHDPLANLHVPEAWPPHRYPDGPLKPKFS